MVAQLKRGRKKAIDTAISMPISEFSRKSYSAELHSMQWEDASYQIFTTLATLIQGIGTIAYVQNSMPPVIGTCATPCDDAPVIGVTNLGNQRCHTISVSLEQGCIHISSKNDQIRFQAFLGHSFSSASSSRHVQTLHPNSQISSRETKSLVP